METADDEAKDLLKIMLYTLSIIVEFAEERPRIAKGFLDAKRLISSRYKHQRGARPAIEACVKKFNILGLAGDFAATGWMLAAVQVRAGERNLPGWEEVEKLTNKATSMLPVEKHRIQ